MASEPQGLRRIRIIWWACFGAVFIYSTPTILLNGQPLGTGLSSIYDPFKMTLFLVMLIPALACSALPFTLFGRKYLQRKSNPRQVVASALLRMAFAEVAVILGVNVFMITESYELYLLFFAVSIVTLLLLKLEEGVYSDLLYTSGEAA